MPFFDLKPESSDVWDLWGQIQFPTDITAAFHYSVSSLISYCAGQESFAKKMRQEFAKEGMLDGKGAEPAQRILKYYEGIAKNLLGRYHPPWRFWSHS